MKQHTTPTSKYKALPMVAVFGGLMFIMIGAVSV